MNDVGQSHGSRRLFLEEGHGHSGKNGNGDQERNEGGCKIVEVERLRKSATGDRHEIGCRIDLADIGAHPLKRRYGVDDPRILDGRDYGDEGVVEYVVSELVRCLHGFGQESWEELPREITGLKVGIVGLGKSGGMIADALKFFGADISYYARSEKEAATAKGYRFLPLRELLAESEVICCCLNKNTILLHEEEFKQMGNRKILFNTGLSPAWDEAAFTEWLEGDNLCFCDTIGALGGEQLLNHPHVRCMQVSTGRTRQAFDRLSAKVLANLSEYNG